MTRKSKSNRKFQSTFLFFTVFFIVVVAFIILPKVLTMNSESLSRVEYEEIPLPYEDLVLDTATFHNETDENILGATTGYAKIPVLMYHNIGPVPSRGSASYRGLFVSPYMFEQQMKYLKDNGWKTITPTQFLSYLQKPETTPSKVVMITFDDGSKGQFKYAYPILRKYKLTAVFYIISGKVPMTMDAVATMSRKGMIIDSHTTMHENLKNVKSTKQLKYELVRAKKDLEKITGKEILSIAYPGCVADNRSFKIVKENGYQLGFSCGKTIYHKYSNRFYLSRVHVFNDMARFKRALTVGL